MNLVRWGSHATIHNEVMVGMWLTIALMVSAPEAEIPAAIVADGDVQISQFGTIAMMPLSSLGSTDDSVEAIERILVGELNKILDDRLVTPEMLLEQEENVKVAFYSCEGQVVCLVEVFGSLGWDAFVVGNITGLGAQRFINLKLIDVRSGREIRRAKEKAIGDQSQLITYMRKAAVELVAPQMFTGTVDILAKQPGVRILIDGKLVGVTPLNNNSIPVPAGNHALEASGDGLVPFSTMVKVAYGENKQVKIDLPASTAFVGGDTPFRHRWWTWAIAGAGTIAMALGGYFNYLHLDTIDRIESRASKGRLTTDVADDLNAEQDDHWNRAVIFYGSGGALLGTVGVLLTIDLF